MLYFSPIHLKHATVAQLVERRTRNAQVAGSNPASSSIAQKGAAIAAPFCYYLILIS